MSIAHTYKKSKGFTLLEVMIAMGLVGIFIVASLNFLGFTNSNVTLTRTSATRDRIVNSIRAFAGMPAALRNSMRATTNGSWVNQQLYTCVCGNPASSCLNGGAPNPLTLYSPLIALDGAGNPIAIQPITSPPGAQNPARFDYFGSPCLQASATCPLEVFTTFTAQCPPPQLPAPMPATLDPATLSPMPTCTIADSVTVTYTVQLDPNLASSYPSLNAFITPVSGSVSTPVKLISGNDPQ